MKKSPIDELYTDVGPFDPTEAARALKPFVTIRGGTHEIYLKRERNLPVEAKILAYALAKKLLAIEGRIDSEYVSAVEISKATGIKKGSVDPAFKNLKQGKTGFLVGKGSRYEIPLYQVAAVVERLNSFAK